MDWEIIKKPFRRFSEAMALPVGKLLIKISCAMGMHHRPHHKLYQTELWINVKNWIKNSISHVLDLNRIAKIWGFTACDKNILISCCNLEQHIYLL